jgi:hypothetical protein
MALRDVDTLDKAIRVAIDVADVRAKWGKQARIPYHEDQIYDALVMLHTAYRAVGSTETKLHDMAKRAVDAEADVIALRSELTKANRQLAAANARATRVAKRVPNSNAGMVEE